MLITIPAPGFYTLLDHDEPEVGRVYALIEDAEGSDRQNKAWHALLGVYYTSRAWSYPGSGYAPGLTYHEFRNTIKQKLGAGYEDYDYADVINGQVTMFRHIKRDAIPPHVWEKRHFAVRGNLKSWSRYTKRERCDAMSKLIAEMWEVGVNLKTRRFEEILAGMAA